MDKVVVILGPTASGKSSLAIKLARKFKGEIISADSRQVYKGMDIATGKVTKKEQKLVPHHLIDVASPRSQFTVSQFKRNAQKKIRQITKSGKLPFLVGGTAFYIYSLIDDLQIPEVKPDLNLRRTLEKKTAQELFSMLKKQDPRRAKTIDQHNKVRLIRALEIIKSTGKKIPTLKTKTVYNTLILGLNPEQKLPSLINKRVDARIKQRMINEGKKLLEIVSHKKLQTFGLEYKFLSLHLQGKLSKDQMIDQLKTANRQFAKRQMTWFKRDDRIIWIKNRKEAEKQIKKFVK